MGWGGMGWGGGAGGAVRNRMGSVGERTHIRSGLSSGTVRDPLTERHLAGDVAGGVRGGRIVGFRWPRHSSCQCTPTPLTPSLQTCQVSPSHRWWEGAQVGAMVSRCGSSEEQVRTGMPLSHPCGGKTLTIVVRILGSVQGKLQGLVAGLRSVADFIAPISFNPITGQDRTLGRSWGCWQRRVVWVGSG